MSEPVLEVSGLKKYFGQETSILDTLLRRRNETIQAVDDVSLAIHENQSQGLIGESGCGKTTLLKTLIGLHEPTAGTIRYSGQDVAEFDKGDWKEFRQNVQIIQQDPFNALDPKMTIKETLLEPVHIHDLNRGDERIREALRDAELSPVEEYLPRLPSQLSGGEKQRVAIARVLILEPDVVLADEPVSMLDVSTQAAILNLLERLIEDYDTSLLYISHDLSTVSYVCDKIHVMYLGRIVETAPTLDLIENPKHPYADALVNAIPIPDPDFGRPRTEVEGSPKEPIDIGEGCRFRDRCPERMDVCEVTPVTVPVGEDHYTACHLYYHHEKSPGVDGEVPPDEANSGRCQTSDRSAEQ
jgi:peptide/nickel transport system ATP-binding protein